MRYRVLMAAILTVGCVASSGHAALVMSFEVTPVQAQGTGTLNVYITPDADVNLLAFGLLLTIDEPFGVDSTLVFLEPPSSYHTDNGDYVFFGATAGPLAEVPGAADRGILWSVLDVADDLVTLQEGTRYLLASITLEHSSIPPPYDPTGEQFTISVDVGNTNFFDDTGQVSFNVPQGLTVEILPTATAAIPEPGSWLMFAGLACAILPSCRRRRRQAVRAG